jgi:hypothetical protein
MPWFMAVVAVTSELFVVFLGIVEILTHNLKIRNLLLPIRHQEFKLPLRNQQDVSTRLLMKSRTLCFSSY